jgi:hypothetical protein
MRVISVIGLGPRGTVLLERIITYIEDFSLKPKDFYLKIFDARGVARSLVYDVDSSEILLNTISSQISLYSGEQAKAFGPLYKGPSLYEFYKDKDKDIGPFQYLSRRDFREYHEDFLNKQFGRLDNIGVPYDFIDQEVIEINQKDRDKKFTIYTKEKFNYESDYVILSTGHGIEKFEQNNRAIKNICSTNGINETVKKDENIIIKGMGLVFFDLMAEFTLGRGGRFVDDSNGRLKYIASGEEPNIFPYTRTGIPLLSRAVKNEYQDVYSPKIFTIDKLRKIKKVKKKLDFDLDVLPILEEELSIVWNSISPNKEFSILSLCHPEDNISKQSFMEYKKSLISFINKDIVESEKGVANSAIKAVAEAIRDMRDNIRILVEENTLESSSYERFVNYWIPIFNRLCVGPPLIRMRQLLALIEADIVKLDISNKPKIDYLEDSIYLVAKYNNEEMRVEESRLIEASIPNNQKLSRNNLYLSLNKFVSKHYNGSFTQHGLSINNSFCVLDRNLKPIDGLFSLGVPTEGYKYFTYVLPRPDIPSTFLKDCNVVAREVVLGV